MSFYDLSFNDSRGNEIKMSDYKGKVVLIVNTATKCGFAPQFKELEKLHQKYKNKNFAVIGFPSNQFANQEPVKNEEMVSACQINFGVTFLLSEKISVNGDETHPVFQFLKENAGSGLFGNKIKWNFTKFLVSPEGEVIKRYPPAKNPAKIENDILKYIEK